MAKEGVHHLQFGITLVLKVQMMDTGADWPIGSSGDSRGPVAFGGPSVECSTSWAFWRILNFENPTRIGEVRALNCFT